MYNRLTIALNNPKIRVSLVVLAVAIAMLSFATMGGSCPGGQGPFPC